MRKRYLGVGISLIILIAVLGSVLGAPGVSINASKDLISIQTRINLAAQTGTAGDWKPAPEGVGQFIVRKGGPSVTAVSYNFEAVGDGVVLCISCTDLPDIVLRYSDIPKVGLVAAEEAVRQYVQKNFEIWTPIMDFPTDDPVRNKPDPILLIHERIERRANKDYLVSSFAYFGIHIYSLEPLKFITRINGPDVGPGKDNWWS